MQEKGRVRKIGENVHWFSIASFGERCKRRRSKSKGRGLMVCCRVCRSAIVGAIIDRPGAGGMLCFSVLTVPLLFFTASPYKKSPAVQNFVLASDK